MELAWHGHGLNNQSHKTKTMSEAIAGDVVSKLTIEIGCTFLAEEDYKETYLLRFPL